MEDSSKINSNSKKLEQIKEKVSDVKIKHSIDEKLKYGNGKAISK